MNQESKLIPVLREGVQIIKMIFFKELKTHLTRTHPERSADEIVMLAGALINELFGTPNDQEPYAAFVSRNRPVIEKQMAAIATDFENMKIPLTDALRVQFLCDDLEGIPAREDILKQAKALDILIVDREIPLPKTFMQLTRRLGAAYHLLDPAAAPE